MERRLGIMQSVEPVLENAIKTLQKVVDVRGMGKASLIQLSGDDLPVAEPWRKVDPLVKNWKVGDKPLVKNQLEKLSREDTEAYHSKQIDYQKGKEPSPEELARQEEANVEAAKLAKAEKDGNKVADKANAAAVDNKGAATKEAERGAKEEAKKKELGIKTDEKKQEKEDMKKKEEKSSKKEDAKEEKEEKEEKAEKKEDKKEAKEEKKEEKKAALSQVQSSSSSSDSSSDEE